MKNVTLHLNECVKNMGQSRHLFVYFHSFHKLNIKYQFELYDSKKHTCCACDSNLGLQDGGVTRVQQAKVATQQRIKVFLDLCAV